ncbi:MAG: hypothetical protein RIQ93_636 [Verrucomicrobiota bacterium]|jgi:putative heme-binding domain-containing protein
MLVASQKANSGANWPGTSHGDGAFPSIEPFSVKMGPRAYALPLGRIRWNFKGKLHDCFTMTLRYLLLFVCLGLVTALSGAEQLARFELKEGDRVVFLGDRLIEGEQFEGWIEAMLTSRFPDRNVTFRNLGWNGDTPAGESRASLSLLQAGKEPGEEGWTQLVRQLEEARPTVIFIGYGMASSFDGAAGRVRFRAEMTRLLQMIAATVPDARQVLLGPIPHEALGAPWPNGAAHNEQLVAIQSVLRELAQGQGASFISLFEPLRSELGSSAANRLTHNGIHLTAHGYRVVAETIEQSLFQERGRWQEAAAEFSTEKLRRAIIRKNEWFFHRSRPANMAYIFGFRKREQGQNAVEVTRFDELIAAEEKRIAQLRRLQPVDAPEIPLRAGNLTARRTEQPRPEFEVAEGFEVSLWAENPLLNKPIQMNFDPQGRLWVASSAVYPQIEPGQEASDRIVVLEDTQHSGRADKATVFAEGLLIPTGIVPGDGGVYVAQSTELLFFKDLDGDGKADVRQTVLSGFGTEDTHHNLHTLHWGPDGRLYMAQSVYTRTNTETPHGVVRLKAGGVYRFDPRDHRLEILYRGWVNTWGHQFDAFGQSFLTDGAGGQGINWGVPGATYFTLAPARRILPSVSPGSYPKFCGIEIIRSEHFPADWQGDVITCDFRAHRVVRFKLTEQNSGYVTKEMPDVLRTTASSFRPLDAKLGPDGALYLADWSNPIIQHGEVDFRDPRRDKEHGRIWRISAKGRAPLAKVDFTRRSNAELLDRLVSPNAYEQERARRVLLERGANQVTADLERWTARQNEEAALLEAVWLYQGFNRPQPTLLRRVLTAGDGRIRAAAIRAFPVEAPGALAELTRLTADEHPRVRLEAVRALGKISSVEAASAALTVLSRPMDPYLEYALWLTMNELVEPWLAAVKAGAWKIEGRESELAFALQAIEPAYAREVLGQLLAGRAIPRDGTGPWISLIGAAGNVGDLRRLFAQLVADGFDGEAAPRACAALEEAARLRNLKPDGGLEPCERLLAATSESLRVAAIRLAGAWQVAAMHPRLIELAANPGSSPGERAAAFTALREMGGPQVIAGLKALSGPGPSEDVRRQAVVALAGLDLDSAAPSVVSLLQAVSDLREAEAFWRSLLRIRGAGAKLAVALSGAALRPEIAAAGLRPAREGNQNQPLVQTLVMQAGLKSGGQRLDAAALQTFARDAAAKGDAVRGERLYRRADLACVSCHAIGGAGGKVGPDMTSIGASSPADYLVEAVLYPNAKIKEGYHSVAISTRDGREFSGMIVRENAAEIVLRTPDQREVSVPAKDIARRVDAGSLMPAGLVDSLLPEERLDLFKFLSMLGKPGEFDASKSGVARSWKLYLLVSANQPIGMEPVVKGDFTLNGWESAFTLVNGSLPRETLQTAFPALVNARSYFAAARFDATRSGPARLGLEGTPRGAWLNGAPVRVGAQFTVNAQAGLNTLVVEFDPSRLPEALKLVSDDVSFVAP